MIKQIAVIAIVLGGSAFSGWHGRGLHEDSKALVALEVKTEQVALAQARESAIAKVVTEKLSQLTASETIIDRGIVREIEKPIYRNVCLGAELVGMLNSAASQPDANSASATD